VTGETAGSVSRVLLCSGKFYYDLAERRRALAAEAGASPGAAIVRVERLYPLPLAELQAELARYPADAEIVWVQEEPANMGAWPRMALKLPELLGRPVGRISLPPSSAPAGGSATLHASEHRALVEAALQPAPRPAPQAATGAA
jgi:2-oxoglutarate dehydrogenase E1 component